ncbi:MAG: hypothetical protein ACTS10_21880 [Kiloniellales bacterium]
MTTHAELIRALGGGTKLARAIEDAAGGPIDREAVYKWQNNGVPHRYRVLVARIALGADVKLPPGFLPDGITVSKPDVSAAVVHDQP